MYKGVHRLGVEKVKAVIAEIDKRHMIVITDKGDFIKVKRQMSAAIGDEIELKQHKRYPISKRLAGLAACFMACIFLSTGVYAYCTPYSYVSVDINPSLSLSLNRFERVIAVNPLTEDAVDFIKDTKSLKNQNIDAALSEIIKTASDKGYIDEETEDEIVVIVSAKNPKQEKKLEEMVANTAAKELSKVNKVSGVTVEKTDVKNYKNALSNKVSPGRETLEDKLKELMPEIKDEEVKDMSVKEVANLIKEGRKAAEEAKKEAEKAAREAEKAAEKARKAYEKAENEDKKKNGSAGNREDKEEDDRRNRDDDKKKDDKNNKGIGNSSDRKDDDDKDKDDKNNNNKKNDRNDRDDKNDKNDRNDKNSKKDKSKNNDDPKWKVNNNRYDNRGRGR